MTTLQCPKCGRKKELDESKNIVMAICYSCQEWMEEVKEDERK